MIQVENSNDLFQIQKIEEQVAKEFFVDPSDGPPIRKLPIRGNNFIERVHVQAKAVEQEWELNDDLTVSDITDSQDLRLDSTPSGY